MVQKCSVNSTVVHGIVFIAVMSEMEFSFALHKRYISTCMTSPALNYYVTPKSCIFAESITHPRMLPNMP